MVVLKIVSIFHCSMNEEFLNFLDLDCICGKKSLVIWGRFDRNPGEIHFGYRVRARFELARV